MAAPEFLRANGFIWAMRIVQLIFLLALLGTSVADASEWHEIDCNTPSKLAYHIAMGIITLFPLIYFILFTGPVKLTKYWHPWVQIGLDSLFVLFWIVAAALSNYDCGGLCDACTSSIYVYVGSLTCSCDGFDDGNSDEKRTLLNSVFARGKSSTATATKTAGRIAAKKGLDAAMIFLFLLTVLTAIYYKFSNNTNSRVKTATMSNAGREEIRVEQNLEMSQPTENKPTAYIQTAYVKPGYDSQTAYGQAGYDPRYGQNGYAQTSYTPAGYPQTGYDQVPP